MAYEALGNYYDHYFSKPDNDVPGGGPMHHEVLRLASFENWPESASGWPSALAHAGFYYEGKADETRCFSCKRTVRHWGSNDNLLEEHRRLNRDCPFLQGRDSRNIPFDQPVGSSPAGVSYATQSQTGGFSATADDVVDVLSGNFGLNLGLSSSVAQDPLDIQTAFSDETTPDGDHEKLLLMKREKARFLSYANWPQDNPVQPVLLAKAGFFFVGPFDRVKCAFCHNVLRNWVDGDNPDTEHAKYYPDCPFVRRLNDGNVPEERDLEPLTADMVALAQQQTPAQQASQLGIIMDRPRHPEYALEVHRLQTYGGYPRNSPVKPETLAKAGFFFTGNGDCVRCFFCDMGLRHWEPEDDPWEEHARWYPRCSFIHSEKGESYIQHIQMKYGRASTAAAAAAAASSSGANQSTGTLSAAGPPLSGSGSWLQTQLKSPAVKTVVEMGYSRALVSRVLERRQSTHGSGFQDVQSLLEAIFEIEESGDSDLQAASTPGTVAGVEASVTSKSDEKINQEMEVKREAAPAVGDEDIQTSDEQSIMEENRQLKEQRVCKVCMDNDVNIVFLPCGHLCCCSNCAPALRSCPICRQLVRGTVRIFLS